MSDYHGCWRLQWTLGDAVENEYGGYKQTQFTCIFLFVNVYDFEALRYINENKYSLHNIQFNQLEYPNLCGGDLAFYLKYILKEIGRL